MNMPDPIMTRDLFAAGLRIPPHDRSSDFRQILPLKRRDHFDRCRPSARIGYQVCTANYPHVPLAMQSGDNSGQTTARILRFHLITRVDQDHPAPFWQSVAKGIAPIHIHPVCRPSRQCLRVPQPQAPPCSCGCNSAKCRLSCHPATGQPRSGASTRHRHQRA